MTWQIRKKTTPATRPASSELEFVSLSSAHSTISSSDSMSQVGNMSLHDDLNNVNKAIQFLKSHTLEKNNNKSPATTRSNLKKVTKVKNYDDKVIECLESLSCITSKLLLEMEKMDKKHNNCGGERTQSTYANVTRPQNSTITIPNKATVQKLEGKIDQVEQDALSKTVMIQGVSIDSLLENNLQDSKYNTSVIQSAIVSEINSFIPQTITENDIVELSVVGRARKHLKVVLASTNMKSSILQGARLNHPTNIYINENLTQKRSALLFKLRVIKKDNSAIGSVYTRNGSIYYKLHSDKNKQYIVNDESDLALIKSDNNEATLKATSSNETTEQLAISSNQ